MWLALCRRTRQVVAYAIGDRGQKTCRLLWERIPPAYKGGVVFTDFLRRPASELGCLPEGAAAGAASGDRQGRGPDEPHRALQQRPPSAAGAVRAEDAFVLEDGRDARELSTAVLARVQSTDLGAAQKTQTILSHYLISPTVSVRILLANCSSLLQGVAVHSRKQVSFRSGFDPSSNSPTVSVRFRDSSPTLPQTDGPLSTDCLFTRLIIN